MTLLALVLATGLRPLAAQRPDTGVMVPGPLAVATFDSAWSRIHAFHYDTTFNGTDWAAVRTELRPAAEGPVPLVELRRSIQTMLDRLGASHHVLIPGEVATALESEGIVTRPDRSAPGTDAAAAQRRGPGDAGMELRLLGDAVVVWRVAADGAAAAAGVRPGHLVRLIDGEPLAARLAVLAALPEADRRVARTRLLHSLDALLHGRAGSSVVLALEDGAGSVQARNVVRRRVQGEPVQHGNLPAYVARLTSERRSVAGGCVGVVRFNVWLLPLAARFDDAVDELRGCLGMVIDLRGNPGGVGGMVMGAAGHFLTDTLLLGRMTTRQTELRLKANPRLVTRAGRRVQPYAGPLAVLIDEMTASTSEFFAAGLQGLGRARVFGTTSAGQALPAFLVRLPNNDVLMYAIADFRGPHDRRIEGVGVVPDEPLPLRRSELLDGRDVALEAALRWIAGNPPAVRTPQEGTR